MSVFKRGSVYWFDFVYKGQRYQKSTHFTNAVAARNYESAYRTKLVNGEVGIEEKEEKPVPTFEEFQETFMNWVRDKKQNEGTREFYGTCYQKLCDYKPLARARLDQIDEPLIEDFRLSVKLSHTTCNRYLQTLRKALRYACFKKKLIPKVPVVTLYTKEEGAERQCDFVFNPSVYREWLDACPEPLRSASILAHDSGICRGELLALQRDAVHLRESGDERGFWGTINIIRGLKRSARRRTLPITAEMAVALTKLLAISKCDYVFTSVRDAAKPLLECTLGNQHYTLMRSCRFHPDAGQHALRHTFLTEAGRHTQNVRALQRLAGHSKIETTMRYVHPDQEDVLAIASAVNGAWGKREVPTIFTTLENVSGGTTPKLQ